MKYYIADLHFGHKNVIKFDNRPYSSTEEMDRDLICRWNNVVKKTDEVYILGDMFWKNEGAEEILRQLNGAKFLIRGNHCRVNSKMSKYFVWIKEYAEIKDGKDTVILCHYPILFYKHSYDPNVVMLCGHVHMTKENDMLNEFVYRIRERRLGEFENRGQIINVGCMLPYMNYTPRTLDNLKNDVWMYQNM